jgi:hypothetical protein
MADRRKGLRLVLDVPRIAYAFEVSAKPEPKLKDLRTREQKVDRESGLPMWSTEVTVKTENGAQVVTVTTVGHSAPSVSMGDLVEPVDLEALPWSNTDANGQVRSGVAFKATELRALVPAAA